MLHKSLVNKLKKSGFMVEKSWHTDNFYYSKGKEYLVEWYKQGDSAICVCVRRHKDNHDSMTDYCAGYFAETLKEIIRDLKK